MEVHAHTHTPRKKWTHYFWEFLMLFLAVFCGFLAENLREHMVEHQREKQFMKSMAEDLESDTIALKKAIHKGDSTAMYSDSILMFLADYKSSVTVPIYLSDIISLGGQRLSLINTDRTSSQLKNSGSMRLIRNKKISDALLAYWNQINETAISIDRYMIYRNAGREIVFKLWVIPEVYQKGKSMAKDSIKLLKVLDNDPKKWGELTNLIAISSQIVRSSFVPNLKKQLSMAENLISLIKNDYHVE